MKKCKQCGKLFSKPVKISINQWKQKKFCSKECFYESMRKKKVKVICEVCGVEIYKKARNDSAYRFCSKTCTGLGMAPIATHKRNFFGSKNPSWKGGITPKNHKIRTSVEYLLWRDSVFARDNWSCQKCGKKSCVLNAHHIKQFAHCPELRTSIENGITLCKRCHKEIHNGN